MAGLYVASDRPGAGRTALASALAAYLALDGVRVAYLKPGASPSDADVEFIARVVLKESDVARGVPLEEAKAAYDGLATKADIVLVESPDFAGGNSTAVNASADLARSLGCQAILVVRHRQGLGPDRVLELARLFEGNLAGVLINAVPRYRMEGLSTALASRLEAAGVRLLGVLPEDRTLLAPTVGQLAQSLAARWLLGEDASDRLVEHFLVGGFLVEWGGDYFGRVENKAVVTRGDKPDVQMAALHTPTRCLVLTSGVEPVQYIYQEAQHTGVPVLLTESDTLETMASLEKALAASSFHHPRKLERFCELLERHANLGQLRSAALR
ncbi:MAG: DRTGG domain-containing protein [Chloroflexota bacterium]|nr:DRTGG domain-containing protein [Chloroflexota bacterium]